MEGVSYLGGTYLGLPNITYRDPISLLPVLGRDTISTDKGCENEIIWLLNLKPGGYSRSVVLTNIINIVQLRPHCIEFLDCQERLQLQHILVLYYNWHQSNVSKVGKEILGVIPHAVPNLELGPRQSPAVGRS